LVAVTMTNLQLECNEITVYILKKKYYLFIYPIIKRTISIALKKIILLYITNNKQKKQEYHN
jgi:hypothetical protein